jgi:hypothetical protein
MVYVQLTSPKSMEEAKSMSGKNPLDGRTRNEATGRIRQDRSDRTVASIREEIPDFAPGVRRDATLGRLREMTGRTAIHDVAAALRRRRQQ